MNISIKKPCATVVLPASFVWTLIPPGMRTCAIPAAEMAATNCVKPRMMVRYQVRFLVRKSASVTAGLNRPPLMRKKSQAFVES